MSFIDVLYEEILLEIEGGEVPKSIQKILAKLVYSEPLSLDFLVEVTPIGSKTIV